MTESKKSPYPNRPLVWVDQSGDSHYYYRKPLFASGSFILVLECCERLAFYGMIYNLVDYLKAKALMSDNFAYTYIELFKALAYYYPLLSGILSDIYLGPYWTILGFSIIYTAGYILLDISSLSPDGENVWLVHLSIMGLIALGTGGIKAAVNVFGAQQFHPEEHVANLTTFFTYFYAAINVGSLIGGIVCPILYVQYSPTACFLVPAVSFVVGIVLFGLATPRYVRLKAKGSAFLTLVKATGSAAYHRSWEACKNSNGGKFEDSSVNDAKQFVNILPILLLILPFSYAYDQMQTTFIIQGNKMKKSHFGGLEMTSPLMVNADPIFVLIASAMVDRCIYAPLRSRGKMLTVPWRFFIGSLLSAAAMLASFFIEISIMNADEVFSVSLWWQLVPYAFIGTGEIFVYSTGYEVAFTEAPESLKVVSSAVILAVMATASLTSTPIFRACKAWMPDFNMDDPDPAAWSGRYGMVHYNYWYLIFMGVGLLGAVLSLLSRGYYYRISRAYDLYVSNIQKKHSDLNQERV